MFYEASIDIGFLNRTDVLGREDIFWKRGNELV